MKKIILVLFALLLTQVSLAQSSDDRLIELIEKKAELQSQGKDLDRKDAEEFDSLAAAKGIIGTAELQEQVSQKQESVDSSVTQKAPPPALALVPPLIGAPDNQKAAQLKAYEAYKAKEKPVVKEKPVYVLKDKPVKEDRTAKPVVSATTTDLVEERALGAESISNMKAEAQKPPKKKELAEVVDPTYSKRLKKEMSDVADMRKNLEEIKSSKTTVVVDQRPSSRSGAIYDPTPADAGVKQNGFVVDRDSQTIITKRVGTKDAVTIKMCIAYGVSIILDESIDTELQRIILDDKIFFGAEEFENKRGVFVRLTKPIPDGNRWESAIRLVRKSDDRTYLVNLIGVSCPEGNVDYPKVVYLKEKFDVLSARQSEVMTPEDMIIQASQGLPRKNLNDVKVYDMVASPGSDWVVFGVEIENVNISKPDKIEFAALDNLQINKINVKAEYMKLQSDKSTELRGTPTYRYKVMMAIDKSYMMKNRYVYLVYLNKETKHYQYIQIDTLTYFKSLKDRGFDL